MNKVHPLITSIDHPDVNDKLVYIFVNDDQLVPPDSESTAKGGYIRPQIDPKHKDDLD